MRELRNILGPYLKSAGDDPGPTTDEKLIETIKARHVTPHGRRLTNESADPFSIGLLQLEFGYKRDDLRIRNPELVNDFLGTQADGPGAMLPILTNSGQAAIAVILTFLTQHLGARQAALASKAYVGTEELAQKLQLELVPLRETSSPILWVCSTNLLSQDLHYLLSDQTPAYRVVVIDTTCWPLSSEITQRLLAKFSGAEVLTLRSLSKLDMGGIEYGSLGVLQVGSQTQATRDGVLELVRLLGAAPALDDIPPYLFDPSYRSYLNERTEELIRVTAQVHEALGDLPRPDGIRTYFPPHHLYFFLYLERSIYPEELALQSILSKLLLLEGVPAKVMASFGFNHCVISPIKNDESNRFAILRISPGQGEQRDIRVTRALGHFFRRLMKPGH